MGDKNGNSYTEEEKGLYAGGAFGSCCDCCHFSCNFWHQNLPTCAENLDIFPKNLYDNKELKNERQ
mgnify:CR=1 FL=1